MADENSFHRKSLRKFQEWLRSDSADSIKDENEKLCQELDELVSSHKLMKQAIDHLRKDYEEARNAFVFQQYQMMKASIKRVIMHVRLNGFGDMNNEDSQNGSWFRPSVSGKTANKRSEAQRKREERRQDFSSEELEKEKQQLIKCEKILRARNNAMEDCIRDLAESFDDSKRAVPWSRYRALHKMIKLVLNNQIINENILSQISY